MSITFQFLDEMEREYAPKPNGGFTWSDPDQSILDDRRGSLPEFPLTTLSTACREWIERAAYGAGVTAAHVAIPLIGICSSLIGTARRVQANPTWTEPMTCWAAIVGASGSGKTPGLSCTRRALGFVERNRKKEVAELRRAHETKRATAAAMRAAWKEQLKSIASDSVVDLGEYRKASNAEPVEAPKMPLSAEDPGEFVAPRLHMSNATTERIAQLLQVQPQGALLLSDELASLFLNMSRYSRGQDNEFWLEAWNGGPYTVERMGRPAIALDHLLVGIVGGFQPDKFARSFKGDFDGSYARFLFSWPREAPYRPLATDGAEVEPEIVNALTRLVKLESGQSEEGGFAPRACKLSPEAVERFERFRKAWDATRQAYDGREQEWWAKMPAHVLRLSGALCFLDWAFAGGEEPTKIDDCYLKAAIELVHSYFWEHARACLRQIGLTDSAADARRALRWMKTFRKTEVTREDIRRDALGQKLNANETEILLEDLQKAGWVKRAVQPPSPKGGRRPARWNVNPILTAVTARTAETYTDNCAPHASG
jgi:hypothetical protein